MKGKKIIVTVTNPLFHDRRMQRICLSLAEQGAQLLLIGVKRKGVPLWQDERVPTRLTNICFRRGFLFYAEYNLRLFFYLLFTRFDLLISVDLDTLPAGRLVTRLRSKSLLYDAHEYFSEVPEVVNRPFVKWVWSAIARQCIGSNNMTVSHTLAAILSEKYGKRFDVIRNLPDYAPGPAGKIRILPAVGPLRLLYIGYLNEGRGLEAIIETMPKLPSRVELILAGSGDLDEKLRAQIRALGLGSRVTITGWLRPPEIIPYLEKAHLGLNLLSSGSPSYYYSLANKTFDYMHFGLPAVHMDFPEYRYIQDVNDCFYLADKLDVAYLAGLFNDILLNPLEFKQKSEANLRAAGIFSWQNEKIALLKVISEAMDS